MSRYVAMYICMYVRTLYICQQNTASEFVCSNCCKFAANAKSFAADVCNKMLETFAGKVQSLQEMVICLQEILLTLAAIAYGTSV